jgi:hypothetical protein
LIDPDFNPTGVVFTYGDSVALSADGSTALVSGSDALNNLTDVAYVFGRSNGTWTLDQQVTERTGIDGYSVALSGDATTALIGDYALNGNAGAAYAFALEAGASAGPPTVVSVTPNAGLASSQTFTAVYSDLNGAADLAAVSILFNVGVSAANACYVAYYPAQNALYLVNDAGTHFLTPTAPGSNTQVSNSQCTLSGKGSSYSTSGDTTSFTAALTFSRTPPEQIYLLPAPVSVTPSSGSGVAQIFTATYSDPNGANDLVNLHLLLNSTLSSVNGCDILYKPVANALYLSDNGGDTFLAPITPGSATQASNNRCTISGTGSSYAASGNEGTLQVAVAFKGVVPEQNLTASDAAPFNKFGSAVAISRDGSIALIGSEGRSETNQDFAGAAYVFTQTAAGWTQQTELTGNDTYYGLFGSAVALSADGSTALVGAQAAEASSGRAYIFVRSGSEWNQQVELTSPNAEPGDIFGSTVALSDDGNTAVIADYRNVYVFTRSGSTWTEQQELTPPNSARDFGLTVALSGNGGTALIGAGQSNAAYVYTRSGSAWTLQQALAVSDQTQGFGSNVALSEGGNNALVVGPNGVYVFTRLGTAWTQQQKLTPADATSASNFGSSVALGNAGSTAMIGAPQGTSSNGAAYIFTRSGTTWSQQEEFVAANSSACCDSFGGSVAISATGTIVLVGDVTTNSNSGSVYAVKLGAPLLPLPTQNIYLLATEDNGSNSNWVQEGTWTP